MPSKKRCQWCGDDPLYQHYHDTEWGLPCFDDRQLFEMLTLEGAQAGLSWITVLRKRDHYRQVFADFEIEKVARFSDKQLLRLQQDPGIIRNRLKIASTRSNAKAVLKLQKSHGSFSDFLWAYVENQPIKNRWQSLKDIPASTPLSTTISKELKRLGFIFVGPTIIYAYMQAIGMVNDHCVDCFRYKDCTV